MRDAFVRALLREFAVNDRVVIITGDLGFGVLKPFWEQYPDRIINAGIAEQGMVGMAAGLAATGRTVFVYSIGNFPTIRPLEQIRNDCAYHGADVKIVCVGGGFVYGSLGMSHHATEDISILRALPGVTCFAPGDPAETEAAVPELMKIKGTCYLRLGRGNERTVHTDDIAGGNIMKAMTLRAGTDTALLSTGGILTETYDAADMLAARGISAEVVSFPCFKPIDRDKLLELSRRFDLIVTAEEGNVTGGFGSAVCEVLAENGTGCRVRRIGLDDRYASVVGNQKYLRGVYGMDAEAICDRTAAWLKG
ncbi:MAG: transketolase C-terminal domain-containing protein [Clostridia bacterium]|nr:transketolase C-terminal domain-containing protein [Clostridia bacterium]